MTPPLDPLAQTLFNEGALARFLVDPDQGTFVAVNPAAERLCGRTARELMGTAAISLFQAKSAEGTQQLRHALAAATSAGDAEGFSLDAGDGSRIPVAVRAVRVEQHGQQTGRMILLTARDLRDELRTQALLAETQAELHRLIGSVSDFVWSAEVDENGYWAYRYYSPVIEKLTGRPPSF